MIKAEFVQSYVAQGECFVLLKTDEKVKPFDGQLGMEFKKFSKKRSLDANAYHWVLCSKMANVLKSSSDEVHYSLMLRYGTPMEGGVIASPLELDLQKIGVYGRMIHQANGLNHYLLYKPSHLYDTKEMSRLIEGTVQEASELGIEVLTPQELKEMELAYEKRTNKEA